MKIRIIQTKQFDPYNKLVKIAVEDHALFGLLRTDEKVVTVVGNVNGKWHYFPSMDAVPLELEMELYDHRNELIVRAEHDV